MVEADVVQRGLAALVIEAVPLPPGDALDRNQEEGLQSSLRRGGIICRHSGRFQSGTKGRPSVF